jgi:FtsP/CotA-like multicopper oxidase with cupredoxin domain
MAQCGARGNVRFDFSTAGIFSGHKSLKRCPYPMGRKVKMVKAVGRIFTSVLLMLGASQVWAQSSTGPAGYGYPTPTGGSGSGSTTVCPRFAPGSVVLPPPDIYSFDGLLSTQLDYNTTVDAEGRNLFCFQQVPFTWEGPTLRINPGDTLNILATNDVPNGSVLEQLSSAEEQCGDLVVYNGSLNIHTHGAPVSPACHQDQVIHTLIGSDESFQYSIPWPYYTPSGLYWYHTHVHGTANPTVEGGASGLIVVGGISNYFPWLAGMPERLLILRDQSIPGLGTTGIACSNGNGQVVPSLDITINYVPLNTQPNCDYTPAVIQPMKPGGKELWRVAAGGADTFWDLQVLNQNGVPQTLLLVALDADPTGSQNGQQLGTPVPVTDVLLAPAARAEFVVATPPAGETWTFITRHQEAGALGDEFESTSTVTIANIQTTGQTFLPLVPPPTKALPAAIPPSQLLANQPVTTFRKFYFDEESQTSGGFTGGFGFFMTVVLPPGSACPEPTDPITGDPGCGFDAAGNFVYEVPFDIDMVPGVITTQGAIEQWTIENHTEENHEFHFHQLHFLVLSQNNYPSAALAAPYEVGEFLDMIQVPASPASFFVPCPFPTTTTPGCANSPFDFYSPPAGASPPSVTIKIDFTGSDIGDFVFHCHILGHEDAGMMQIIRVTPPAVL